MTTAIARKSSPDKELPPQILKIESEFYELAKALHDSVEQIASAAAIPPAELAGARTAQGVYAQIEISRMKSWIWDRLLREGATR